MDEGNCDADGDIEFQRAIVRALSALEDGDRAKTVSTRDEALMAFLVALEECPTERAAVGRALAETVDRDLDPGSLDRSTIVRLAVRAGLETAAPEAWETLRAAVGEHARRRI